MNARPNIILIHGAWAEGWHAGASLDYAISLGLHSSAFTASG